MRTDVNVLTGTLTTQQWGRPRWFSRLRKLANLPNLYQNRMEGAMGIEPTSEAWEALNKLLPFSAAARRAAIYF